MNTEKFSGALRRRAEQLLAMTQGDIAQLPAGDIQDLVYKLQLYQIELRMQNEELNNIYSEMQASRDKYHDLFDFAPIGYVTLDEDGTILEANLAMSALLGANRWELIGKRFAHFVARCCQERFYLYRKKVMETGKKEACELEIMRASELVYVQLQSLLIEEIGGIMRMAVIDVTERTHALNTLERELKAMKTLQQFSAKLITADTPHSALKGMQGPDTLSIGEIIHQIRGPVVVIAALAADLSLNAQFEQRDKEKLDALRDTAGALLALITSPDGSKKDF